MSSNEEKELEPNSEMIQALKALQLNKAYRYIVENIEHWKTQCLNELLKPGVNESAKGEFSAYGRVLNAPIFFIQMLETNPGKDPTDNELDPTPRTKVKRK